jgi:hypothetical protein
MHLKRLKKAMLMLSPELWLGARAWWRTIAGKDEAEIGILRFLVPRDRCAIDVGANIGIYTHKLLEITAQVVAIEPNPIYVKKLAQIFGSSYWNISYGILVTLGKIVQYVDLFSREETC